MQNFDSDRVSQVGSIVPVLKVEGLTVYRGRYAAVQNVSFELQSGTSTAIVGPNGSGKSTLVQAVLDLLPRSSGSVEIFGRPLTRLASLRHQVGYVPQNFIFDRTFPISVAELVELGWVKGVRGEERGERSREKTIGKQLYSHLSPLTSHLSLPWQTNPEKKAAIAQALRRVNVDHLQDQAIGTLSGGELKRVLLAYCLVIPRRLLILDEAFAGVDVQGEADFYDLLNDLKNQENWTVLQVSHDLEMVSRHCDQILCLNQRLVCSGKPEIALSPQNLLATYGPAFSHYQHRH